MNNFVVVVVCLKCKNTDGYITGNSGESGIIAHCGGNKTCEWEEEK